jgi:hypothetical protein
MDVQGWMGSGLILTAVLTGAFVAPVEEAADAREPA